MERNQSLGGLEIHYSNDRIANPDERKTSKNPRRTMSSEHPDQLVKTEANRFNQKVNQYNWVTEQEKTWANYYFNLKMKNLSLASILLSSIQPIDKNEQDLLNIETIKMKLLNGQYPNQKITTDDVNKLNDIARSLSLYTNVAVSMLRNVENGISYLYSDELLPTYAENINLIRLDQNLIEVYPNPAKDKLSIIIATKDKIKVNLEDVAGRILKTMEFSNLLETTTIDISELNQGLYIIVSIDESNKYIQRIKFVKLK
ncbi:MAG: T9SS type A sorting domain-containing protein [Bacteroidota bacterium]